MASAYDTKKHRGSSPLLEIDRLTVTFETDDGAFKAVDDVSFSVEKGEIVGLVGESGCGKTVTALSLLRLIPSPPGRIGPGSVFFSGEDLLKLHARRMRKIRGHRISMIFQEPSAALSPLHRIGSQLVETIRLHRTMSRKAAHDIARHWMKAVKIPDVDERMFSYPFQLSGGMQQRIMIAMALMLEPQLIIADEPTTALDVTIQAQIFDLIRTMRKKETAILLITHDMGVVWEMCDRVIVMYASRIAEEGRLSDIFSQPAHPYTRGLLNSIPKIGQHETRPAPIPGQVPSPYNFPSGCHFRDRCPEAFDRCGRESPPLFTVGQGHRAACFLVE
jgi:peptide/nickel transport system ATP-binding protein